LVIGGLETAADGLTGFTGELDEFRISIRSAAEAAIKFASINQGLGDAALRAVALGEIEGGGKGGRRQRGARTRHALRRHREQHDVRRLDRRRRLRDHDHHRLDRGHQEVLLSQQDRKGNKEFLKLWKPTSTDLTALDHADTSSIRSMGGSVDEEDQD
jgi:hypothetical protein